MTKRMTRGQAKAYQARWTMVNDFEREELQKVPLRVKFRQLAALMASVDRFGWREALGEGEAEVRERWQRLRRAYRG